MEIQKKNRILFSMIVLLGIFFPTSILHNVISPLNVVYNTIFILCAFFIIVINKKIVLSDAILASIISIIVFSSTLGTIFFNRENVDMISWGILSQYLVIIAYALMNERIFEDPFFSKLFKVVSYIIIIVGLISMLRIAFFTNIFTSFYSFSYKDLVSNMIGRLKPVTFFGSHSIAGFIYFMFLEVWLKRLFVSKDKRNIIPVVFFGFFLIMLQSSTSYFLLGLLLVSTLFKIFQLFGKKHLKRIIIIGTVSILLFGGVTLKFLLPMLLSKTNGILSRFTTGLFSDNILYLKEHPFLGSGFLSVNHLYYTDFGYMVTYLRGGVFLIISIAVLIFKKMKPVSLFIVLGFILFEVGYPVSLYFRLYPVLLLISLENNNIVKNQGV
ncbi:hypothetical protein [Carnobacterium maltaromaticum]|uniref:hypothetical protein n=1 Tax=Carnobacterium maltaromaticum TaxID=2751 RepID=UPI0039BDAF64